MPATLRDLPAGRRKARPVIGPGIVLILAAMAGTAPGRAGAEWRVHRWVGQVEVRSEIDFDPRLAAVIDGLPAHKQAIERTIGLPIPARPIELNIFANRDSYAAYLQSRVPGASGRPALFVTGVDRDRVYVCYGRQVGTDIRHECTHAYLHARLPYVPLWLDEGLAEYFELPPEQRFNRHAHLRELRTVRSRFRWRPDLERLEALAEIRDMHAAEYRESWAWAHWMLHGPEPATEALRQYLGEIAAGRHAGALRPRLAAIVDQPEEAVRRHIRAIR